MAIFFLKSLYLGKRSSWEAGFLRSHLLGKLGSGHFRNRFFWTTVFSESSWQTLEVGISESWFLEKHSFETLTFLEADFSEMDLFGKSSFGDATILEKTYSFFSGR